MGWEAQDAITNQAAKAKREERAAARESGLLGNGQSGYAKQQREMARLRDEHEETRAMAMNEGLTEEDVRRIIASMKWTATCNNDGTITIKAS